MADQLQDTKKHHCGTCGSYHHKNEWCSTASFEIMACPCGNESLIPLDGNASLLTQKLRCGQCARVGEWRLRKASAADMKKHWPGWGVKRKYFKYTVSLHQALYDSWARDLEGEQVHNEILHDFEKDVPEGDWEDYCNGQDRIMMIWYRKQYLKDHEYES